MMKKKILFGSVFAALIMLSLPFISTVNAQSQGKNNVSDDYDKNLYSLGCFAASYNSDLDNPGGWVTNIMNYIERIAGDVQVIWNSRGIGQDLFGTFKDTLNLIKNLKECKKFVDLIIVVKDELIPTVQKIISVAQDLIGLVQAVIDLTQTTPEFVTYVQSDPWNAPVLIRGTVSGSEGALEAHVTCNDVSQDTSSDGYYSIEVPAAQPYIFSSYSVTASAEGFNDETGSTGMVFPDGIITLDFELSSEDDDESDTVSKNMFLISKYQNSRIINIFASIFLIFNKLRK